MFPGYGPRSLQASNLAPNGSNFPRVAREEWPSQARFLAVTCLNLPVNVSRCFLSAMFIFPLLPFAHFFIWCLRVGNAYVYCLGIAQLCPYLGGPVHLHLGVPIHCTLLAQYNFTLHLGGPIHCTLVAQYICALHLGGPVHFCLAPRWPNTSEIAHWWPSTFVPCTSVAQYVCRVSLIRQSAWLVRSAVGYKVWPITIEP